MTYKYSRKEIKNRLTGWVHSDSLNACDLATVVHDLLATKKAKKRKKCRVCNGKGVRSVNKNCKFICYACYPNEVTDLNQFSNGGDFPIPNGK